MHFAQERCTAAAGSSAHDGTGRKVVRRDGGVGRSQDRGSSGEWRSGRRVRHVARGPRHGEGSEGQLPSASQGRRRCPGVRLTAVAQTSARAESAIPEEGAGECGGDARRPVSGYGRKGCRYRPEMGENERCKRLGEGLAWPLGGWEGDSNCTQTGRSRTLELVSREGRGSGVSPRITRRAV